MWESVRKDICALLVAEALLIREVAEKLPLPNTAEIPWAPGTPKGAGGSIRGNRTLSVGRRPLRATLWLQRPFRSISPLPHPPRRPSPTNSRAFYGSVRPHPSPPNRNFSRIIPGSWALAFDGLSGFCRLEGVRAHALASGSTEWGGVLALRSSAEIPHPGSLLPATVFPSVRPARARWWCG